MRFFSTLVASVLGSLIALGIILVFFFIFIIGLAASSGDQAPRVKRNSVLVYKLSGSIPENVSGDPLMQAFADESQFDLRDFLNAIEAAETDDRIKAIWIRVGTSGLSWATAQEVRNAIIRFKTSGKSVVASSADYMMTENSYFVASAADKIYASPEALFEFNGFYVAAEFYKKLLDKLDVQPQVIKAGRYKGAVEPYERDNLSAANREQTEALLSSFETVFNAAVQESRGISAKNVADLAQRSALLSAEEAVEANLIDGLLFHDEIEAELKILTGLEDQSNDLDLISVSKYVLSTNASASTSHKNKIGIVYAEGIIVSGGGSPGVNPFGNSGQIGADTFRDAMRAAAKDDDIDAIVVRINSPGGFAPAADEMRHEIEVAGRVKPVVISMGGVAASGGYWMATAADSIIADPLTITGSIGVYSVFFDVGDLFESRLGITYDIVETNPYADMYSGLRPFTADEQRIAQRAIDNTYQSFLEKVAENRHMTTEQVDDIAQGRVWSGKDALEVGLVDRLGSLDDAINLAASSANLAEDSFGIVEYPKAKSFFEQFGSVLNSQVERIAMKNASNLELETIQRLRLFDDLFSDHGAVQARMPFEITIQ